MELDPYFCEVITNRYMDFTGNRNIKIIRGDKEIEFNTTIEHIDWSDGVKKLFKTEQVKLF